VSTIDRLLDHLEGDAPVQEVLVGAFWTAVVLDTDPPRCGLASTLRAEDHHSGPPIAEAGHLRQRSGRELAEWLRSPHILKASVGMATFNALLDLDPGAHPEINAAEVILERGAGRRVAIVGHFPFVGQVREVAEVCWVVEKRPRPGDLAADRAAEVLPQADVVALTGTSLLNHTYDDLVRLCRPDAFVLVLGPSTPLSPLLLQDGVNGVSGTWVDDSQRVLRSVAEGATFRQIKRAGGLRLLTMMAAG
jgi:hypothetical protein